MRILNGRAYNADCFDILKDIPDGSIDCIITDPPYGTTACKWDTVIPFEPMWEELKRIIKPNGAIVLFGSEPFSSALRMSNIKQYKYDWIYKKRPVNFLNAKKQPMRNVENISVFGGKNYYPQGLVYNPKINKRSNSTETNGKHGDSNLSEYSNYPNQILEFTQERGLHPTQKPVALIEYLIKTYTNENETVLDFTAGSFTTAIAAENTNRKWVCIEKDEGYYNIGINRLNNSLTLPIKK